MVQELRRYLLKNKLKCIEILKICSRIGSSLNSASDRFMKAEIIDRSYQDVLPEMVYKDAIGYDFLFGDCRISSKSKQKIFCPRVKRTEWIELTNTRAKDVDHKRRQDFDLLILTQTNKPLSIAITTYDAAMKNKVNTEDQIKTRINYEDLVFIVDPSEKISFKETSLDLKLFKQEFMKMVIRECKKGC